MYLPHLNRHLATLLIEWAEISEDMRDGIITPDHHHFDGWGRWEQDAWARRDEANVCGTSYCQAGQAAVQAGHKPNWRDGFDDISMCTGPDRMTRTIEEVATVALGLTRAEADLYFGAENTISDLKSYLNGFARARRLNPPYPHHPISNTAHLVDDYDPEEDVDRTIPMGVHV